MMRYKLVEEFLTADQCNAIIEMAKPRLEASTSWNVETGRNQISEYRTSKQCYFQRGETPLIADVEQRIANITGTKVEQGEGIQAVHYDQGNYYKQHFDYFDTAFVSNESQLNRGGQRIITAMVYLNEPIRGGGTHFPRLGSERLRGHTFRPVTGRLLIWYNIDFDGNVDDTTIHIAEPVEEGTKDIITKWIRQRAFV